MKYLNVFAEGMSNYFKRFSFDAREFLENNKNKSDEEQKEILKSLFPKINKLEDVLEPSLEFTEKDSFDIEGDFTYTLIYQCKNGFSYELALEILEKQGIYEEKSAFKSRFNRDTYASAICDKEIIIALKKYDLRVKIMFPKKN